MKIGIIKEGKIPVDKRVPLTPKQCKEIQLQHPLVEVVVQSSDIRSFTDAEYAHEGIEIVDTLEDCDVVMGVKEVPVDMLINHKTFLFFSHTIKKQPYNKRLLQEIIKKDIQLIDYECLTNERGLRLIGFGRYAGVVGAYNGFLTYGALFNEYPLKPAHLCKDRKEMEAELDKINTPNLRIVLTGKGRVSKGSREILNYLNIKEVSPKDFLTKSFKEPVFCNPDIHDLYALKSGGFSNKQDYYEHPDKFVCVLNKYLPFCDMIITGHVWTPKYPKILSNEDLQNPNSQLKVMADITCDIDDPIACTIRPCEIGDPYYHYDPVSKKEVPQKGAGTIAVMAVDNLPCELPRDASEDFGAEFIKHILPELLKDHSKVIERASIAKNGGLTPIFEYLKDYVA